MALCAVAGTSLEASLAPSVLGLEEASFIGSAVLKTASYVAADGRERLLG